MERLDNSKLKVGDVVYTEIGAYCGWAFIGYYYRKEVIKRITPKRNKIVTDKSEHRGYAVFYKYNEKMEEINKNTFAKKNIHDSAWKVCQMISKERKHLKLEGENLQTASDAINTLMRILEGDENDRIGND